MVARRQLYHSKSETRSHRHSTHRPRPPLTALNEPKVKQVEGESAREIERLQPLLGGVDAVQRRLLQPVAPLLGVGRTAGAIEVGFA